MSDERFSFEPVKEIPLPTRLYPLILEVFMEQEHKIVIVNVKTDVDSYGISQNLRTYIKKKDWSDKIRCSVRDKIVYLEKLDPAKEIARARRSS